MGKDGSSIQAAEWLGSSFKGCLALSLNQVNSSDGDITITLSVLFEYILIIAVIVTYCYCKVLLIVTNTRQSALLFVN